MPSICVPRSFAHKFKLICLGEAATGRSSFIQRLVQGTFVEPAPPPRTYGVEFQARTITVQGAWIHIELWDSCMTAEPPYFIVPSNWFGDAKGAFVFYDVTRKETFDAVERLVEEARDRCVPRLKVVVIVGMKADLIEQRQVEYDSGAALAASLDAQFVEVSAKTGHNAEEALALMVSTILSRPHDDDDDDDDDDG